MLSEELIFQKVKNKNLSEIKILNLYGKEIEDIQIIKKLINIEILSLSLNKISSLKPLKKCYNLKELYLRKNNITNLNEINYLTNLKNLKILRLEENPICNLPNYKTYILNKLPQLIRLDNFELNNNIKINKYIKRNNTEIIRNNYSHLNNINYYCKNNNNNYKTKEKKIKNIILKRISSVSLESNSDIENINSNPYSKNSNLSFFLKFNNNIDNSKDAINSLFERKKNSQNKNPLIIKRLKLKIKFTNDINKQISSLNTNDEIKNNNVIIKKEKIKIRNQIPISKSGINLLKIKNESSNITRRDLPNLTTELKINSKENKIQNKNNFLLEKALTYINKMNLKDLIELKNIINYKISLINNIQKEDINNLVSK